MDAKAFASYAATYSNSGLQAEIEEAESRLQLLRHESAKRLGGTLAEIENLLKRVESGETDGAGGTWEGGKLVSISVPVEMIVRSS